MSKRKVTDPVTKFKYDLVRTPTSERGTGRLPNSQTYFKRNYLDTVKIITPDVYFDDDIDLSGTEVSIPSQVINSHIVAADSSAVIYVSSLDFVDYLSSVSSITGLAKYFVKQNNLTWIASKDFEKDILVKLGKTYSSFDSSADFLNYLSGTFLPTIVLQKNNALVANNLATNTASAFDNTSSGTHKYLIDKLSWIYFLNTSDAAGGNLRPTSYATSSEVATVLASKFWRGEVIALEDGLKIFEKYLWSNYYSFSSIDARMIPTKYRTSGAGTWSSGTQQRERLETLVDVVYAGDYFNNTDTQVEEAFNDYTSVASLLTDTESAGPLSRFLEALSFSFADRVGEATELETLVDIDSCPDEFLPYLADLIGWTLIGPDATRQRNQLRQAVSVYKAKGTKRSIQAMVDTVFGDASAFNVTSGTLFDLWESYVPNLLFYTIATSSTLTERGIESFTQSKAQSLGLDNYSSTDVDKNIRLAVDRIMWELANEFPNNFIFGNKLFPRVKFFLKNDPEVEYTGVWSRDEKGDYYGGAEITATTPPIVPTQDPNFVFEYRGRKMPIPPWEDIKYYAQCELSPALLTALKKKLLCFGVNEESANSVYAFINNNCLVNETASFYTNSFLFFTTTEMLPFNYGEVIDVRRPDGNELVKYLPYWSSKASHFKILLSASSFDFTSNALNKDSKYALSRIKTLVNTVAPAHAIPDIMLDVSTVEDTNVNLSGIATQTAEMGLSSLAASGSSATFLTNFAVSTVNPRNRNVLPAGLQTVFRRSAADSLADGLFASGISDVTEEIYFSAAPRNAIRRKNYKYLMEGENIDFRDGKGAAGYQWLYRASQLPSFYPNGAALQTSGILSLGFIASSLSFASIALLRDPNNFGNLIDRVNLDPVWHSCQAYNSSDAFYDIEVSNTFPFRGLSGVDSSAASSFFDGRGSLSELQALQYRVKEQSIFYEASSIVSGLYNTDGTTNAAWAVSSSKIQPTTLSSWYVDQSKDVVNSIANQLHESASAVDNANYIRDFAFGSVLHRFYREWLENYTRVPINFNKQTTQADDLISHTYGPYVFNSDFEITASSIDSQEDTAGVPNDRLVASTVGTMIGIGWDYGRGILTHRDVADTGAAAFQITNTVASDASDMYVSYPEIRNDTFLSGIELVDTSTPFDFAAYTGQGVSPPFVNHPTFGFLKLAQIQKNVGPADPVTGHINNWGLQSEAAQHSILDDNLIVRYARPDHLGFPRLRYKIEPDSSRPDIKNFLTPESEYQLDIHAANVNIDINRFGGRMLKVWVHTEPMDYTYKLPNGSYRTETSTWSFFNGKWVRTKLSDINDDNLFEIITTRSLGKQFSVIDAISLEPPAQIGTATSIIDNKVITPYGDLTPRIGCEDGSLPEDEAVSLLGQHPQVWGGRQIFETLSFNFDTNNSNVVEQPDRQQVHAKNRKYYMEIFFPEADDTVFLLLDTIKMHNKTQRQKAVISTGYNNYELNKKELKACFDYFTELATGTLASRDAFVTSGNMELSGGGRLSYRDNIFREIYEGGIPPFSQVSSLIIRGN